jgi:anaerobic selenocysteine-containing dehydrogenase
MRNGVPVRATGNKASPLYHGFCCSKGQALPEHLTSPTRLLHSVKRQPDGTYGSIGSQEAIREVTTQIQSLIAQYGPSSIALYIGSYGMSYPTGPAMAIAWMQALGSPMIFSPNTIDQPGKDIAAALLGSWEAGQQTFRGSDVWMIIGANPMVSLAASMPVHNAGHLLTEAIDGGMKLIVIDPRRSQTAKRAAIHLQPRPGHDAAILAAMLRIILTEERYDKAFATENVQGIGELRRTVEPFTPAYVARVADVPEEQLVEAARTFASAKRGVAAGGTGANMSGHSSLTEYLIQCLNAVCGRYLREGEPVANPGVLVARAAPRAQPRGPAPVRFDGFPMMARGLTMSAAGMPLPALAEEILAGKVRALISVGGNPVAGWPDQNRTIAAIEALDLFVQLDIKMSASAKLAHYVIAPKISIEVPTASCNEAYEMISTVYGFLEPYGLYAPKLVDPPAGSDLLEEWEFFFGIARRMNLSLTLTPMDAKTAATRRLKREPVPVDMTREPTTDDLLEMITRGSRVPLAEVKRYPDGALFPEEIRTAPKDASSTDRLDVGNALMMSELAELLTDEPQQLLEYPYQLVSRRLPHVYNSSGRDLPSLIRKGGRYNAAYMHPEDIAALGITAGDAVEISSAHGRIPGVVQPDRDLRRGLVSMTHAFGDLPQDHAKFREFGSNTSQLTNVEDRFDRHSGIPLMSAVPVNVRPLVRGDAEVC